MKKPFFMPVNEKQSALRNHFNVLKYRELTANPNFKRLFIPKTFIPLLWDSHNLLISDKGNHIKLIRYFTSLWLSKRQQLYLLENLILTFNRYLFPDLPLPENDEELDFCLDFISIKCDKLTAEINTGIFNQCYLFDFTLIKKIVNTIPCIFDKLKYLESVKTDFLQYEQFQGLSRQTYFLSCCDQEIKKLRKFLKYEKFQVLVSSRVETSPAQFKSLDYTRKYISDKINNMDVLKWKYFCFSDHDFYLLVNTLTEYFFSGYIDPEFKLKLKPHCKTRLCTALYTIYNHLSIAPLKYNNDFLSLLQKLSIFESYSPARIYHSMIKTSE